MCLNNNSDLFEKDKFLIGNLCSTVLLALLIFAWPFMHRFSVEPSSNMHTQVFTVSFFFDCDKRVSAISPSTQLYTYNSTPICCYFFFYPCCVSSLENRRRSVSDNPKNNTSGRIIEWCAYRKLRIAFTRIYII